MVDVLRDVPIWCVDPRFLCQGDSQDPKYSGDFKERGVKFTTARTKGDDDPRNARAGGGELDQESK